MSAPRIGVFGGRFDPVHVGHLAFAEAARERFGLERVVLIPSHRHRRGTLATAPERLAMLRLAIRGRRGLEVAATTLQPAGPRHASECITQEVLPLPAGAEIFFLLGSDKLEEFPIWTDLAELQRRVTFVLLARAGHPVSCWDPIVSLLGRAKVEELQANMVTIPHRISATQIRDLLAGGQAIDQLVPPRVARYIAARGLYTRRCEALAPSEVRRIAGAG